MPRIVRQLFQAPLVAPASRWDVRVLQLTLSNNDLGGDTP
jgi:hypothetical protein